MLRTKIVIKHFFFFSIPSFLKPSKHDLTKKEAYPSCKACTKQSTQHLLDPRPRCGVRFKEDKAYS